MKQKKNQRVRCPPTEITRRPFMGTGADLSGSARLRLAQSRACQVTSSQLDADLCGLVYERIRTVKSTEGAGNVDFAKASCSPEENNS